jgi:hypothetical protein
MTTQQHVHGDRQRLVAGVTTFALVLMLVACGGTSVRHWTPASDRDSHDDPAALRPGYGSGEFPTWWPLTESSVHFYNRIKKAKAGDAQALLDLALLASGDHRDADGRRAIQQRVDKFITRLKPEVSAAANDLERGYLLYRSMHEVFFNGEKGELGSYKLEQSRVTAIFDTGRYNCISSAMLFVVLTRAFGLPVRGVLVPTHAFVEFGPRGGKVVDVETTSVDGFAVLHDERFYKEAAAHWTSSRGLRPITIEDYRQRQIVEPYRLMAMGMINQAIQPETTGEDRGRLVEMAALVDPESVDVQRARMQIYALEARTLYERKAQRTLAKMFDAMEPELEHVMSKFATDSETMRTARWVESVFADALQVVGRSREAAALVDDALPSVDMKWEDSTALRQNFLNVLNDQMLTLMTKKNYVGAITAVSKHMDACRKERVCASNLAAVYGNWANDDLFAGNRQGARKALQECVAQLPDNAQCAYALQTFGSR